MEFKLQFTEKEMTHRCIDSCSFEKYVLFISHISF